MADIIAIRGSARRKGNSDSILDSALDALYGLPGSFNVETLTPYNMDITPCRSCNGCWETGRCVVNDCMQDIYKKIMKAQHVILSTPVYFTSLPGHLKVFIDRFQCFWVRTYRLGSVPRPRRKGLFFCIGAMDDNRFFDSCSLIVKIWMSTFNMKCAVSRFYPGLDDPSDIIGHSSYSEDAAEALKKLTGL